MPSCGVGGCDGIHAAWAMTPNGERAHRFPGEPGRLPEAGTRAACGLRMTRGVGAAAWSHRPAPFACVRCSEAVA